MLPMNRPEVAAHSLRIGACLLLLIAASASLRPAESHVSPHARVQAVDLGEARWTRGFWADRFETCRQHTIPSLWRIMAGTNHTHYFENFRIAAGLAEGRSRGAPFNDGDFYKWIEAVCALEAVTKEDAWAPTLDDVISVIARAQRSDGYLHTPVLIRQREGDPAARPFEDRAQFEMYNMGHLFTAAAVHFHATGKTSLLAVARKASDFLDQAFRDPAPSLASHTVCPSHYMGLIDLYRATGEPRHLALAQKLFHLRRLVTDGGDDNQDRLPFERQTEALGHAVRANYLYAGAADLLAETGDPAVLEPLLAIWTNVVQRKLYITGGCGALHDGASPDGARDQKTITRVHQAYGRNYQLPHTTAHNETCAAIGNALWNWRMFLLTGEARFVDELERALYNGILSGISLDGARFFYANPLRQTDPLPVDLRWPRSRVPYLSAFCCPPNIARTLARSIGFAYAKSDRDIWVNLYGGSLLDTRLPAGGRVRIAQETEYPWNGRIRLRIEQCDSNSWGLRLRIPGWARRAALRVNAGPPDRALEPGSYAEVRRPWRPGDVVDLDIDMPPVKIEAHPLVEETINQAAVQRGPLVYCLESADLPDRMGILDVLMPDDADLAPVFDRRLLGGVVAIEAGLVRVSTPAWTGQLYREIAPARTAAIRIRLVPYFAWANRGASEMTVWLPRQQP